MDLINKDRLDDLLIFLIDFRYFYNYYYYIVSQI